MYLINWGKMDSLLYDRIQIRDKKKPDSGSSTLNLLTYFRAWPLILLHRLYILEFKLCVNILIYWA